jgi:hypothetical protein
MFTISKKLLKKSVKSEIFGRVPLLKSGAKKIFAVSKNFTCIKVAHRCRLKTWLTEFSYLIPKKNGSHFQVTG